MCIRDRVNIVFFLVAAAVAFARKDRLKGK